MNDNDILAEALHKRYIDRHAKFARFSEHERYSRTVKDFEQGFDRDIRRALSQGHSLQDCIDLLEKTVQDAEPYRDGTFALAPDAPLDAIMARQAWLNGIVAAENVLDKIKRGFYAPGI